jgi:hypothetical protein
VRRFSWYPVICWVELPGAGRPSRLENAPAGPQNLSPKNVVRDVGTGAKTGTRIGVGREPAGSRPIGMALLGRGGACREECVLENEASDLGSQRETCLVVDPGVNTGVDPAEAGFADGGAEARERAGNARECR